MFDSVFCRIGIDDVVCTALKLCALIVNALILRPCLQDVYDVPLPEKHRFPMDKYRKVREGEFTNIVVTSMLYCCLTLSPALNNHDAPRCLLRHFQPIRTVTCLCLKTLTQGCKALA